MACITYAFIRASKHRHSDTCADHPMQVPVVGTKSLQNELSINMLHCICIYAAGAHACVVLIHNTAV